MSRDAAIESWLASMSESELIDQCFFWHDMALEHGRMYNAVKDDNVKLRELVRDIWREGAFEPGANYVTEAYELAERTRELGIEVGE